MYHRVRNGDDSDDEFSLSDDEKTLFRKPAEIELNLYPETRTSESNKPDDFCKYFSVFCTVVVLSITILTVSVLYAKNHGPKNTFNSTSSADTVKVAKNSTEWVQKLGNRSK